MLAICVSIVENISIINILFQFHALLYSFAGWHKQEMPRCKGIVVSFIKGPSKASYDLDEVWCDYSLFKSTKLDTFGVSYQ